MHLVLSHCTDHTSEHFLTAHSSSQGVFICPCASLNRDISSDPQHLIYKTLAKLVCPGTDRANDIDVP